MIRNVEPETPLRSPADLFFPPEPDDKPLTMPPCVAAPAEEPKGGQESIQEEVRIQEPSEKETPLDVKRIVR